MLSHICQNRADMGHPSLVREPGVVGYCTVTVTAMVERPYWLVEFKV